MSHEKTNGVIVAAPHSGAGKTLFTLGLLRALTRMGVSVAGAKVGPDFIDPAFHQRSTGLACRNLDLWAMGTIGVRNQIAATATGVDFIVLEGVMGLFDGADDGTGSTAHVAKTLDIPIILLIDASAQSWSVAPLVHGFSTFDKDVKIAGVVFNKVSTPRHRSLLERAVEPLGIPVLGCLPRVNDLTMPSRHLGLVQADEYNNLDTFIEQAADMVASEVDLKKLQEVAEPVDTDGTVADVLPPLGQHIAIARDQAFTFSYPHLLMGWRDAGAEVSFFSPLNDEVPSKGADAIFLPGGYPELHAGVLAGNHTFLESLRAKASDNLIYGECGGYMVLGDRLVDAEGVSHKMAGLLPVTTSFENRKRTLGYRRLSHKSPLPWPEALRGHEFHYSTQMSESDDTPLFESADANGVCLPPMGVIRGNVMGSYAHVISASEAHA